MNLFIFKIERNEITNLSQLKSFYRKTVKLIHPDISGKDSNDFLGIQQQFKEATLFLKNKKTNSSADGEHSKEQVKKELLNVFIDLMSSNFPQDRKISGKNKLYKSRIVQINALANQLFKEKDLFILFEKDLYILRKDTVISNHKYNLVISYLNNIKDYILMKHKHGYKYIETTYDLIYMIFIEQQLGNGLKFVNWLVSETIGISVIKGDLPTTVST
jgi:hypothetical protein